MCLFSLSWNTCGFSAPCHAAGGPSGVPLLADSGWLLYSCGDGFAWGWGLSCTSCPVPPLFSFLCLRSFPFRCFPFGVLPPYRVGWHVCLQFAGLLLGLVGGVLLRLFPQYLCAVFPAAGTLGFSGLLLLRLLAGVVGALHPVSGGVPLLLFPYLRVGVLLAKVSPEFVGYEGGFGCPSWFVILFLCRLVHLLFLELGWFLVTRWWLLLRLLVLVSSVARLHLPDAFASSSTPISGGWMVQAPAFSWALPWVLPSRFPCGLLARDD